MSWLKILGIIFGILILFILVYYILQDSPKKYYRKARNAHKNGEKVYNAGDFEQANSYYMKADEYRRKARELE